MDAGGKLSNLGRPLRIAVGTTFVLLLLAGALVGEDDHFPLGPMRMFATSADPDGRVAVPVVVGIGADGTDIPIRFGELGVRRAEIEGRLPDLRRDPSRLASLIEVWHISWPDAPVLSGMRIDRVITRFIDGVPTEPVTEPLVEWTTP